MLAATESLLHIKVSRTAKALNTPSWHTPAVIGWRYALKVLNIIEDLIPPVPQNFQVLLDIDVIEASSTRGEILSYARLNSPFRADTS